MFLDGYDLYVGTSVLGATLASEFSRGRPVMSIGGGLGAILEARDRSHDYTAVALVGRGEAAVTL